VLIPPETGAASTGVEEIYLKAVLIRAFQREGSLKPSQTCRTIAEGKKEGGMSKSARLSVGFFKRNHNGQNRLLLPQRGGVKCSWGESGGGTSSKETTVEIGFGKKRLRGTYGLIGGGRKGKSLPGKKIASS